MKYRRWIFVAALVLGLLWLNGPGIRWIAPRAAVHFLEKSGLRGNFKVSGSLTGGLSFSDLKIEGDKELASLTIGRVTPVYRWRGLIKGRLEGLTVDGVHVDLRLGLTKNDEKKPPLDLRKLVETLRTVRGKIVPVEFDLKNISLTATRDGKPALSLASSRVSHKSGSGEILLELGAFTEASGREWPARESAIAWTPDALSIARVDPYPGVSLRDLLVRLPAGGEPSAEAELHLDDAVFVVNFAAGFASARIDLREGKLDVAQTAKRFGFELPAAATLTSLAVELDQILPVPKLAIGSVRLLLENIAWQDWSASELGMDATLAADQASVTARGVMLGTGFSLDAAAPVTRGENRFILGDAQGQFNIADVPKLVRELSARAPALDPQAPVPPSRVDGNFKVSLLANQPQAASADFVLKPDDEQLASAISFKGLWAKGQPLGADLVVDGLTAAATYQPGAATYQATLALDEFSSSRIDRWLAVVKVKPGGTADLTGKWSGSGELKSGKHLGELSLSEATWSREVAPPVTAIGGIRYDWPAGFETQGLRLRMNEQTVALEASLANNLLELRHFLWSDGKKELAEGTASLPVPQDFSKWRETLAKDARPLAVSIKSRVLSLGVLKEWLPAMKKLDPRSTGQLDLQISGTYSEPVVDAVLEAKDLRAPAQPKLPPADLKFVLAGRDGRLTLSGSAIAPDFPAAVMKASMAFRPADWAEVPERLKEELVAARVDLPRLDLSRFSSLVPAAERIAGIATGNIVVSGTLGKPGLKGVIDLSGIGFRFKNDRFPAVEGASAAVDLGLDRITLKSLKCSVAGGNLQGDGSLTIIDGKPGEIDLRLRGDHLPLVRDDVLILRANADLRLQGPWLRPLLSGSVGAVDSIFYRDIELLPIGSPFVGPQAAALPKIDAPKSQGSSIPEPFRDWALDVQVGTREPLLIRGNLATGEIVGKIRIGGTIGAPAPDGVLEIKDFRAALPFSTLSVRSGTATFTPASGFDPMLEIRGTAEPRPYRVTVYAYGRASDPQLVLTSNPPLPENEIMTLLATGTTTSGLEDPQAASSRAMQLLVEEMRRGRFRIGKRLRPLLGLLDRVDFSLAEADPYSSESFSTATLSITDRWFLSAGMSATGDSRMLAIWRLSFR
ncbi:MAG: hypothetical protein RLZZ398_486 [Verrucomicrobiota bacterium]